MTEAPGAGSLKPEARSRPGWFLTALLSAVFALTVLVEPGAAGQTVPGADPPVAVRNDVARPLGPGDEVLMLRHQRLQKGSHELYYRASVLGVWPWFERLGARMSGQWQVVYPEGGGSDEFDEGYRLARYASVEHWRHTRGPRSVALGGNGPNAERNRLALEMRRQVAMGSDGGYFLQGVTATTKPQFLPGLEEDYVRVDETRPDADDDEAVFAVRNDVHEPGTEIIELRYQRIRKGTFDRILESTVLRVWPFEEKVGARPIGQWKVIYPDAPSRTEESPDYDEMVTMTRYASHDHYLAAQLGQAVFLGGNGPDWDGWREALRSQHELTLETTVEFLQGFQYTSPPVYQPGLAERYRRSR